MLIKIANAGKGAAVTALLCRVFQGVKRGMKLLSAIYGCVSNRTVPASRAAPSPIALRGLVTQVIRTNYRCTFVRIDSRSVSRGHVDNLSFGKNVFAGLAHSRLSCRGAIRGCLGTGGGFFSSLPTSTFTLAGTSSGTNLIVLRGATTEGLACSLHALTSFGKGVLRSRFRKARVLIGKHRIVAHFINHFGTCGLLTICKTTISLNGSPRRILIILDSLRSISNHFRAVRSPSKCATVISCTRAPSTLAGILGDVRRILGNGNHIVAIINYNNGHSGKGHPVVTGRTTGLDSRLVLASSGPHFRRPSRVVGSVITNLGTTSVRRALYVASHTRTVGATAVLTEGNSIVLITNGNRRSCRRMGNIGRRFSSQRRLGRVFGD